MADEMYFGGAAGGGKTALLIGLAITAHRNSLILRRRAVDTKALSKTIRELNYGTWKYSGSGGELITPEDCTVEVGGCEHEDDKAKYQGAPHDFIGFDELPTFTESQYTFIIGWNRVANPRKWPNQRCRVVGAGNPPTDPEGEWVLRRWRAWMPGAQNPAKPGELRWYTTIDGKEIECEDGKPVAFKDTLYTPRSRTFIPARLEDNPDLMKTGYAATLEAMQEPLRSMFRYGDMLASRVDHAWQLIPTRWVVEAQRRWPERMERPGPLSALGMDPSRGGVDKCVIAPRYGMTIGNLLTRPGKDVPDGQTAVNMLLGWSWGEERVPVNIDTIGIGASAYDVGRTMGLTNLNPVVVSEASDWYDPKLPGVRFFNLRSAMMWKVRSLLDPEGGPPETRLALPPDPELLGDLTAPRYEMRMSKIKVESKDDIAKRIGRSTDMGDSVCLACWEVPQFAWAIAEGD